MDNTALIQAINAFAARHNLTPATVCQYAIQNSRLHKNLLSGRGCNIGTAQKLLAWLSSPSKSEDGRVVPAVQANGRGTLGKDRRASVNPKEARKQ